MRWDGNYPYVGRQPPTVRGSVRKRGAAVSGDGQTRLYERNSQNVPYAQTDYLMHRDDSSQSLAHFGIPGMKWGVRRFQNDDGTLTEEGKQRYGRDSEPESKSWKKSDASNLSDDELRRRNNRLQSERQYRDLTTTQAERDRIQMRNEIKKDFLKKALLVPVGAVLAYAGTKLIKNKGTKIVDMLEKFGKKAVGKIKASRLLKQAANRGHDKYTRSFSDNLREFFPRKNGGYGGREYNYWPKANKVLPKNQPWPEIPLTKPKKG